MMMMKYRLLVKLLKTTNNYGQQFPSYKTGEMASLKGSSDESGGLLQVNDIAKIIISAQTI